jgi:hypothetical protein
MSSADSSADRDLPLPPDLAAPARRALIAAGYTTLEQITQASEHDLLKLHGMGPKGIRQLRAALQKHGWSLADDDAKGQP